MSAENITFSFGDVIGFYEDEYIFLVPSLRYVYIAKILTHSETKQVLKSQETHFSKGKSKDDPPLYWIVRLSSDDFEDQAVTFANAPKDVSYSKRFKKLSSKKINARDLVALKGEILKKNTWPELKELIRDIDISFLVVHDSRK